ncbi:hypothetical protein JOL79_16550 [Microbispora sp. RL4-1S]|uniref:Uncharacterized protein n=1 Tax=Microbispora oryzae TaxID=2806554 RepID=A0A940WQU9_9ACTN|nr:hypothetical protein [Microbispora oryzae]MBP2705426.1 hypothetical protein [Microbispora oryzae]
MTTTRRRYLRGLRPMVLVAAMIAPAILASGLLAAQFSGYEEMARGSAVKPAPGAREAPEVEVPEPALPEPPLVQPPAVVGPVVPYEVAPDVPTGRAATTNHPQRKASGHRDDDRPVGHDVPAPERASEPGTETESGPGLHAGIAETVTLAGQVATGGPAAAPKPAAAAQPGAAPQPAAAAQPGAAPQPAAQPGTGTGHSGGAAVAPRRVAAVAEPGAGSGVLEPTAVPEPFGPARMYGGLIRLSQPEAPAPMAAPRRAAAKPPVARPGAQEPALVCSFDLKDAGLWDLCRDQGTQS